MLGLELVRVGLGFVLDGLELRFVLGMGKGLGFVLGLGLVRVGLGLGFVLWLELVRVGFCWGIRTHDLRDTGAMLY